ncbi:MAG: hypothetical protein ACPGWR_02415 [Ardenticatenaceae bacterium]
MKTIYSETARICEYKYHYNDQDYQEVVEAGFSAKFDVEEQIIKLDYCAYLNMNDFNFENLGHSSEHTEVVYLYHVEELINDFEACKLERPHSLFRVCLMPEGRLWRWLVSKADAHYHQIMKIVKEWWNQHRVIEGEAPTGDRFLLWMADPDITLVPQSN